MMEDHQQYVPLYKLNGKLIQNKLFFVGDGLSVMSCKNAQNARKNAPTATERLEGLIPMTADWHFSTTVVLQVFILFIAIGK